LDAVDGIGTSAAGLRRRGYRGLITQCENMLREIDIVSPDEEFCAASGRFQKRAPSLLISLRMAAETG